MCDGILIGYVCEGDADYLKKVVSVISAENFSGDVLAIPETWDGCPVTHVGYITSVDRREDWSDYQHMKLNSVEEIYRIRPHVIRVPKNVKKVIIPSSVIDIGEKAFWDYNGEIEVDVNNPVYKTKNGWYAKKEG